MQVMKEKAVPQENFVPQIITGEEKYAIFLLIKFLMRNCT